MRYVILIAVNLKTVVSGMGRCIIWYRFTDIWKKPAASNRKIDQPPIYSAGKSSTFFSNTCICHHIPDGVKFIIISIIQPCSCLPSGFFLSCSRPFKTSTSDTGWVQGWVACSGTALQASKSPVQFLMGSFGFFIDLTLRLLMSYIYIWSTYSWCF